NGPLTAIELNSITGKETRRVPLRGSSRYKYSRWMSVLPTGDFLLCFFDNNKVVEVDKSGKTLLWSCSVPKPFHGVRLRGGNTVVAYNKPGDYAIVELDRKGEKVWATYGQTTHARNSPYLEICLRLVRFGYSQRPSGHPGLDLSKIPELRSKNPLVRKHAISGLLDGNQKARQLFPLLIRFLADDDSQVRFAARGALFRVARSDMAPLVSSMRDKNPLIRAGIIDIIGDYGPNANGAVPDLLFALKDKDPRVREQAVFAINRVS